MWLRVEPRALVARKTRNVSRDLELETVRKRFQSRTHKPVN